MLFDAGTGARGNCKGPLADHWDYLELQQIDGYSPFLVVNGGGQRDSRIDEIRAVFIDSDGDIPIDDVNWHQRPDFLVRRNDLYWHAYWLVSGIDAEQFRAIQRRLAAHYGTDPNICNPSRVMRVPGFMHLKDRDTPQEITLLDLTREDSGSADLRRTVEQITFGVPEIGASPELASRRSWGMPSMTTGMFRMILSHIDPTFDGTQRSSDSSPLDGARWVGMAKAIRHGQLPLLTENGWLDEEADWESLCDEWCSGELWRNRTGEHGFMVHTYKGSDELLERTKDAPRNNGPVIGLGTFIHLAREAGFDGPVALPMIDVYDRWQRANPDKGEPLVPRDNGDAAVKPNANAEPGGGESDQPPKQPEPLVIRTFGQVLRREPAPVEELIPGRLEKGIANFLSGPGGVHKSRLVLQGSLCVEAGADFLGATPTRARSVYIAAEDDFDEVTRRAKRIADRLSLPRDAVEDTIYIDRYGQPSALVVMREGGEFELTPFHGQICDYLAGLPGHKLVVLDSAYDFVRFAGHAKIDEDAVNVFIKQVLGRFCLDTDSTLWIPWHPSYAGQQRGDGSGWSVAWHNAPRARDSLRFDKDKDCYVLEAVKRNHSALPKPIDLYYDNGALVTGEDRGQKERRESFRRACVGVAIRLAEAGTPITKQKRLLPYQLDEIGKAVGYTVDTARVKDELGRATLVGELVYVPGTNKANAGFYPLDWAGELSRRSK